jgi:hypothetical protein
VNSHSLDKQDKEQILQQCLSAARSIEEKL